MAGILVYSEQTGLAEELISYAVSTGKAVTAITFNEEDAGILASCGADVCVVKGASDMPEAYGKALAGFIKDKGIEQVLIGATARGRNLAASIAGYLDCPMASDVSYLQIVGPDLICQRMTYGGLLVSSETLSGISVVTVGPGMFEKQEKAAGTITSLQLDADNRVKLVAREPVVKQGVDLTAADKIVCVGMGMDKEEDLEMVRQLAQSIGAELGCTRGIAEERHWLPPEQYIGISGQVIKPQLYIGIGVSGQVQHVYGVREAKVIVAVNNDEKAPLFKSADYGIVGDMYEVVPLITEAIRNL